MKILLVEDHADVAEMVSDFLSGHGHQVDRADDGSRGLELALANDYDAIVLDRILPKLDGTAVCGQLRRQGGKMTPVLMLTALTTTSDKLTGFAAGADDYLTKPFDLSELEARLIVLDRRARGALIGQRLKVANLIYDCDTLQATRGGKNLALNPTGRRILEYLLRNSHRVVSRAELELHLWGGPGPSETVLRVHIHDLRNAIDGPFDVKLLHTIRGAGYRLALPDAL